MSDDHTHVQEFFTARAARWDARFPDDGPAYAAAVAELGLREGERVLDAGCGTGRALTPLRAAVGASGVVLGADLTPAMLEAYRAARRRDTRRGVAFTDLLVSLFADGRRLPTWGRGLALTALDAFPPARRLLAERMIHGAPSR